jgi:hypothetical protein
MAQFLDDLAQHVEYLGLIVHDKDTAAAPHRPSHQKAVTVAVAIVIFRAAGRQRWSSTTRGQ